MSADGLRHDGAVVSGSRRGAYNASALASGQTSDSFLSLPLGGKERSYGTWRSVEPVRSRALVGASSPVTTLRLGVITDATPRISALFSSGRLAPMRHRHHQQLLAEPGSGTEVPSRGGQSASGRCVRRAARRPESRSFARSRPGRFLGSGVPSMRFLDPRFYPCRPRTAPPGLGRGHARPVGDGVRQAGSPQLAGAARLARSSPRAKCVRSCVAGFLCIAPSDERGYRAGAVALE